MGRLGAFTYISLLTNYSFHWQERVAKLSNQRITAWKAGMVLNNLAALLILPVNIAVPSWATMKLEYNKAPCTKVIAG